MAVEAAAAAAAKAAELDRELQLERSRSQALERKLSGLQSELAAARCGGPEALVQQQALIANAESAQAEAELTRGVLQRTYAAALNEAEAETSRAVRTASHATAEGALAARVIAVELRRMEGERQAAAARTVAEARVEAESMVAQQLRGNGVAPATATSKAQSPTRAAIARTPPIVGGMNASLEATAAAVAVSMEGVFDGVDGAESFGAAPRHPTDQENVATDAVFPLFRCRGEHRGFAGGVELVEARR